MVDTYLIKSDIDGSFYCGISSDIIRRLHEHNSGKLACTAKKRPWKLSYCKHHDNYAEARKHEKWLKKKNIQYKEKLAQLAPPEWVG